MTLFSSLRRAVLSAVITLTVVVSPATAQERIVSIGGDITEILFALEAGDRVVAADSTSLYPQATEALPKVGYLRQLSAEGVLSAEPDLIIISGAAGPETALELLRASGVPIVEMDTEYSVNAIIEKTAKTAEAVGQAEAGQALIETIKADWGEATTLMDSLSFAPKALFVAATEDGAARAAGAKTAADGVIRLMRGNNVFEEFNGYKTLSLEGAVAADPDIIIMMTHHADRVGGKGAVKDHPALSLTRAAQNGDIYFVDQLEVMQFSPRTPKAIARLVEEIAERRATKQ
ncbi:MAG: ABC transporter substrate-binding protein [Pseudomonadota bacterium]